MGPFGTTPDFGGDEGNYGPYGTTEGGDSGNYGPYGTTPDNFFDGDV